MENEKQWESLWAFFQQVNDWDNEEEDEDQNDRLEQSNQLGSRSRSD